MALAAAPAVALFGGGAAAAAARTEPAEICLARLERFTITAWDFAGTPVGIDARLVVELGVTPQITTGVLHAHAGTGQIGAGVGISRSSRSAPDRRARRLARRWMMRAPIWAWTGRPAGAAPRR